MVVSYSLNLKQNMELLYNARIWSFSQGMSSILKYATQLARTEEFVSMENVNAAKCTKDCIVRPEVSSNNS